MGRFSRTMATLLAATGESGSMSARYDSVDSLPQAVAVRLPGPARPREEILAELNDGLREAAEANQRAGVEHAQAIGLVVNEFGNPDALAASFRPELMLARRRRTALAPLAATPVVRALWTAAARSRKTAGGSRLFDSPADHIVAGLLIRAVIVCGTLTVVTTGRASRWPRATPLVALLGATATGAITVVGNPAALRS